jgi:putative oxidoreductase
MSAVERFGSWAPKILGISRFLFGTFFACHGAQKVFGVFGGMPPGVPKLLIWTAGPIELVGGVLIAIGLCTRITAFICSGQMAIAYFTGHAPHGFWPTVNGGELAIFYCWFFLYIAAQGPGAFALDNLIKRRPEKVEKPYVS